MTVGDSRAEPTITRQPALAPSPQPRPAPTGRALVVRDGKQGGPFWTPIWGPNPTPIDSRYQGRGDANKALEKIAYGPEW
jgi:hypothetical protein